MTNQKVEIERKFLVKQLPDLSGLSLIKFERHYLYRNKGVEIRVQSKGDKFEFERKIETSELSREGQVFEITQEEFSYFKAFSICEILRDGYLLSENPEITLKIYHGKFEGLVRAEVEFQNESEATKFKRLDWFGKEITNSPLGRDGKLMELSEERFKKLLLETL